MTEMKELRVITACKRHNPAAGATQGYERLHSKRQVMKKPNSNLFLQKNTPTIFLDFTSASLP